MSPTFPAKQFKREIIAEDVCQRMLGKGIITYSSIAFFMILQM